MSATITEYTSVRGLQRALKAVPKHANKRLRDASGRIAGRLVPLMQERARGTGRLQALIAPTIKVKRDRVPAIVMGGTQLLPSRNGKDLKHQTIGDVIFGGEFGGGARPTTRQFLPHLGTTGRFFYPVVREQADETMAAYSVALDAALRASK